MYHITTSDPTSNTVKTELERVFDTHTVTAEIHKEHTPQNAVLWSVTCTDCGRSEIFTLTVNDESSTLSPTTVEAFETRPCTPVELPSINTGEHTVTPGKERASEPGTRDCHCSDCGRTINVPMNDSATERHLKMFADMPCQDTYTDTELGTAVIHPVNPTAPERDALHISHWQYEPETTRDPTTGYWWHETLPLLITLDTTSTEHKLRISFLSEPLVNSSIHDYSITRADTNRITELTYSSTNENGEPETHYETIADVLRFMQYVNDMSETNSEYQQLRHATPLTFFEVVLQQCDATHNPTPNTPPTLTE